MYRFVPLATFENDVHAIIAADADGTIRYCNRAAASLFDREPDSARGLPCWKLARLRGLDGGPFCAPDCPIQREACQGRLSPLHHAARYSKGRLVYPVDIITFLLPGSTGSRRALLHLFNPRDRLTAPNEAVAAGPMRTERDRLSHLSVREAEVLGALASGRGTSLIAERLSISPITVCNHIENILRKLGVHSRLAAVLLFLRHPAGARAAGIRSDHR